METLLSAGQFSIAANEDAFLSALFTGPKTFDGFIRRVVKSGKHTGVHFRYRAHEFCANAHGVICYKSDDNGQTRYRFTNRSEWPFDMRATEELFTVHFAPLLNA